MLGAIKVLSFVIFNRFVHKWQISLVANAGSSSQSHDENVRAPVEPLNFKRDLSSPIGIHADNGNSLSRSC